MSAEILASGTLIAERYLVERSLGSGGMGAVYLVSDQFQNNEPVAMKVLHPDLVMDDRQTQRFMREVQLMRRVEQKNVVRTFDVGSDEEVVYFTMEYVPGKPLESFIEEQNFPPSQLGNLIIQVCSGLEAIHRAGIIHRDLKPANIMVLEDFSAKITDFGVARPEYSELTAHNEIIGSALYIAPEIWLGTKLTPSADLYSLGVLLYELTTGVLPFDGDTPAALMRMHLEYKPAPPKQLNSKLQPWLSKLILWLLEKSAEDRPADAREVINYVKTQTEASSQSQSGAGEFLATLEAAVPRTVSSKVYVGRDIETKSNLKVPLLIGLAVCLTLGLFSLVDIFRRLAFPELSAIPDDLSNLTSLQANTKGLGVFTIALALQAVCGGGFLFALLGAARRSIKSLVQYLLFGWFLSAIFLSVLVFIRTFQYSEGSATLYLSILKELVGVLTLDSVVRVTSLLEMEAGQRVYLPDVRVSFFNAPLGHTLLYLHLLILSAAASLSSNLAKTLARTALLFFLGGVFLALMPAGSEELSMFYLPLSSLPVYFLLIAAALYFSRPRHRRA